MKNSTLRIENSKNFDFELYFIEKLNSLAKHKVRICENEDVEAEFSKQQDTFIMEIFDRCIVDCDHSIDFSFFINEDLYKTKRIGNISNMTESKINENVNFLNTVELKSFCSHKFKQSGLYKFFYIVDRKDIKTFHSEFETITHTRNKKEIFYDCLRITLEDKLYDVTQLKTETKGYYIFECLQSQNYEDFSDICFSIRQAIGFINRLMVGGEEFVFDEENNFLYSNNIRPTIRGLYSPIVTNPYSRLEIDNDIADNYLNQLTTRVTLENLSKFVHKIHTDSEFSTAILVILEASSIRSLLIIPSSFAVIIELLSKKLNIEEKGLEKPINDPVLANKIIDELHKVIDSNCASLTESNIIKLKRRLNEINKTTNKVHLTNNEKLTHPFEQLGIDLTLHDIAIIERRNDLLHGDVLLKANNSQSDETTNTYIAYVSAKLFTLISKLILKSIGYEGYIYNQAKFFEKYLNFETEEKYFEKI